MQSFFTELWILGLLSAFSLVVATSICLIGMGVVTIIRNRRRLRERDTHMPTRTGLSGIGTRTGEQLKRALTLHIPFTFQTFEGRRIEGACPGCKGYTYALTFNDREVLNTCSTCLVTHCTVQKKLPLYVLELVTRQFPDYATALENWKNRERKVLPVPNVPQEPLSLTELSRYLKTTKGYGHNHAYTSVTNAVNMARKRLMEEIGQQEIYADRIEAQRGKSNQQAKVHRELAELLRKTVATLPE